MSDCGRMASGSAKNGIFGGDLTFLWTTAISYRWQRYVQWAVVRAGLSGCCARLSGNLEVGIRVSGRSWRPAGLAGFS
jgi:hypothetical protein